MAKTKIVVIQMKELIYTAIFAGLGILLIVLLIIMFFPSREEKNKTIFSKLLSLPFISVFLFSNEPDVHSIGKVALKNVAFRKEIFDLSDNNEIWNLLTI